jgi:hypothetical protein
VGHRPPAGLLHPKFLEAARLEIGEPGEPVIDQVQVGIVGKQDNRSDTVGNLAFLDRSNGLGDDRCGVGAAAIGKATAGSRPNRFRFRRGDRSLPTGVAESDGKGTAGRRIFRAARARPRRVSGTKGFGERQHLSQALTEADDEEGD